MKELILEFRKWNDAWNSYDYNSRSFPKPSHVDKFIEELSTKYKVIKLDNEQLS